MVEAVCERRDGVGATGETAVGRETIGNWADSGTGNCRDGNKTPYGGMVNDAGRETDDETDRDLVVGNEKKNGFLFP